MLFLRNIKFFNDSSKKTSLDQSYPIVHWIFCFVGLHLQGQDRNGKLKIMPLILLMFVTFTVFILCYLGYLINLLLRNWSYDVFLGNFKDALNMIYLLSVYFLTFCKKKTRTRFFHSQTIYGVPNPKWWVKVFILLSGLCHSGASYHLCREVENTIGKCIMYVSVTYTLPFLVDLQILINLSSLVHAYRKAISYIKSNRMLEKPAPTKKKLTKEEIFSMMFDGANENRVEHLGLTQEREVLDIQNSAVAHKEVCWYLVYFNDLLNKMYSGPLAARCGLFLSKTISMLYFGVVYWKPPFDPLMVSGIFLLIDEFIRFCIMSLAVVFLFTAYEDLVSLLWNIVGQRNLNANSRSLMSAVASRLYFEPAGLHCGGMGVMGPGLFYSLSGVAVTYMVILYQNRPPE